jgi:hypothetical protein
MATKFFENNGKISLATIASEQDLPPKVGIINMNPPPQDGRCECCGRHLSELKPFGKAGDPLVGDFDGALLVKRWRPDGPYDEDHGGDGFEDPLNWLISEYGEKKGTKFYWKAQFHDSIGKSWECRDCIVLDEAEYFAIMSQRWAAER